MIRGLRCTLILLAATGLVAACSKEEAPPPEPPRPIKILEVGAGSSDVREYPGTIKAVDEAELSFEVPGRVVKLDVKEGQWFEKGAVLAKLDNRDFKARLDSAAAQRNNTRVDFERARTLFEKGVLAQAERDRRKAAFDVADAKWREARKAYDDTVLLAPFAGRVARKLVELHENVMAKMPVMLFQDDQNLEIRVAIPERDLTGARRAGGKRSREEVDRALDPHVVITSIPDRSFPAAIQEISAAADPMTRTFEAKLSFDAPKDVQILPGMTAKVTVKVPTGSHELRIPATVVLGSDSGKPTVWIVDPKTMKVSPRTIQLGALSGSDVTVTGGLGPGDQIALSGVHQLHDGMIVRRYTR